METMSPPKARPAAMTPEAFAKLLAKAKLGQTAAARALGVNRHTIIRWLKGTTPIAEANALLIKARLKK